MIHSCDDKKEIMIDHYDILHKEYNYDEYYYCCCLGTKLGYYEYPMKNERFDKLVS